MMQKHLRHMAIFCKIVDAGSISAAAAELDVSKSVISQHLKTLEDSLGVALIKRTTRKQQLTPAGQDFYHNCQQIITLADQAWQQAQETQGLASGPVNISAPHAFIADIIAPAMGKLCSEHPLIRPNIEIEDLKVNTLSKELDFVVRVGKLADSNMIQQKLGSFRDVLCAHPSFLSRHKISFTEETGTQQRVNCDYIANHWQGKKPRHNLIHTDSGQQVELTFTATRFSNSLAGVVAMAQSGAGLALIPDFIFTPLYKAGLLAPAFPSYQCILNPVYALHNYGTTLPLAVKLALESIKQHFPK